MSDVFLSYAREDTERASLLAHALEQQGHKVWWDRKILSGRSYERDIKQALETARCVIVLWSADSVESDWVKDEAAEGKERNVLVPVRIDDVDIPLGFGRIQTADLAGWHGDESDPHLHRLFQSVAAMLGQPIQSIRSPGGTHPSKKGRQKRQQPAQPPAPRKSRSGRYLLGCGILAALGFLTVVGLGVLSMIGDAAMNNSLPPPGWSPPPPDGVTTSVGTTIYLRYTGDALGGCALTLFWNIGGVSTNPTLNPQPVNGVPLGQVQYQASGSIVCPMAGFCNASGSGSIDVGEQATYDIVWQQIGTGATCSVALEPAATY